MPRLSVIVAAQDSRPALEACLESLRQQHSIDQIEIIVADGLIYPSSLPMLLGAEIGRASGDLIAITEGHCRFPPEWADNVFAAHEKYAEPAIGGAVEPGEELSGASLGLYFADYGQFMLPLRGGIAHELPGENVSFKRSVLDAANADFSHNGFWKTFFCQSLERGGSHLISDPAIVTSYHRQLSLRQLITRRLRHGRCFGAMRAESLSPRQRVIWAISGILLPALLMVRLIRKVGLKVSHRSLFIRTLPFAFIAILCWSVGEWYGNLFGSGNACDSL